MVSVRKLASQNVDFQIPLIIFFYEVYEDSKVTWLTLWLASASWPVRSSTFKLAALRSSSTEARRLVASLPWKKNQNCYQSSIFFKKKIFRNDFKEKLTKSDATGSAALLLREKNPMQSSFVGFFRSFHKKSVLVSREVKTGLFFSRAQLIPGSRSILEKSEKERNLSN